MLRQSTISEVFQEGEVLRDTKRRRQLGLDEHGRGRMVVELNLLYSGSLEKAQRDFRKLYSAVVSGERPQLIADTYFRCSMTVRDVQNLVSEDRKKPVSDRIIYRVWPDFPMHPLIDKSVSTIKGDAARRSYEASGLGIVWAVIDSGINARHPHFSGYNSVGGEVRKLHRDFTAGGLRAGPSALVDRYGHGTHVAGIIAGGLPADFEQKKLMVGQRVTDEQNQERIERRAVAPTERLSGVAPLCKLVSLKVLDNNGNSNSTDVMRALEWVRKVNGYGKLMRIQGVNLSLGYEFDAKWFACGQSPICVEVDRLVRSGVVVVVAAGNTGYGDLTSNEGLTSTGLSLTINDPGNAALAITVGATHRDSPHTYGVSYFSSKGPTGDGRLKPDLVAPGERITSSAAGIDLAIDDAIWGPDPPLNAATYLDRSGTSMAAPHVSGAIAAFLSIRREFIGHPDEVKDIFLRTATTLGRERYFEGHGLVDVMRAIQSV